MPKQYIVEMCSINTDALKEKIKISPVGDVQGLDGRVFEINGQQVLDKLNETGLELVLNISHSWNGEAAGWFSDYELREDGIYAALALNENGQALIEKKHYKYLSPEYFKDWETNEVYMLVGVGLVNQPNLLNDALNNIDSEPNPNNPPANKPEENTMADPNPTELQAQIDQLTADNAVLVETNATLAKQVHANKIDAAINHGQLAPAKRDFALELNANAIDAFLTMEAATFKATDDNNFNPDGEGEGGDADCAIAKQYSGE